LAATDENPRRTAIYVRISQDATGKKAGTERQLKDCKALARRLK
jgi:DNA invertase Pin-like site-specific DNA recombinase